MKVVEGTPDAGGALVSSPQDLYSENRVTQWANQLGNQLLTDSPGQAAARLHSLLQSGVDTCQVNELRWWDDDHGAQLGAQKQSAFRQFLEVDAPKVMTPEPVQGVLHPDAEPASPAWWSKDSGTAGVHYLPIHGQLFVGHPNGTTNQQGELGDCYFDAAVASLMHTNPAVVEAANQQNVDGTDTVMFYVEERGGEKPSRVAETVTQSLPVNAQGGLVATHDTTPGELYNEIDEKAYAQLKGGYGPMENDYPGVVFTAFTGNQPTFLPVFPDATAARATEIFEAIRDAPAKKIAMATWTYCSDATDQGDPTVSYAGTGLFPSHVYSIFGAEERNGVQYIWLRNPHGRGAAPAGSIDLGAGQFLLPIDRFIRYFAQVDFCQT